MIGFRNRVVRGYEDVDPDRTLAYAAHTSEFDRFRVEIVAFPSAGGMNGEDKPHPPSPEPHEGPSGLD